MATTVSNQDLGVATKGSDHNAQTQGATDVCFDPPKQKPTPHPNTVPTTRCTAHTTPKTCVADQPVLFVDGIVGPPSDDAHPDLGGGVVSGTYRMKAEPTSGSPNVKTEGSPVVRATDPTTQNNANTTGQITPPTADAQAAADEAKQKLRCTIEKLELKCIHAGDPACGGRTAGTRKFLEVLQGNSVEVKASRINAIEKGKGPVCPPPPGGWLKTRFTIERTGGRMPDKREVKEGIDLIILGPDWTGNAPASGPQTEMSASPGGAAASHVQSVDSAGQLVTGGDGGYESRSAPSYTADMQNTAGATYYDMQGQNNGAPLTDSQMQQVQAAADQDQQVNRRRQDVVDAANADVARRNSDARRDAFIEGGARNLVQMWKAIQEPAQITITAEACSGSKVYTVRAFPRGPQTFDLMLGPIGTALGYIKSFGRVFEKVGELFNKQVTFEWMVGPSLKIEIDYRELTRDVNSRLTKNSVNRYWYLVASFAKLVGVSADFSFTLLAFAGVVGGAVAWLLGKIPQRYRPDVTAGVVIEFNITPKIKGGLDEYRVATIDEFSITVGISFFFNVRAYWGDFAELRAGVVVKADITFWKPKITDAKGFEFELKPGEVALGFKGTATLDVFGFRKGRDFEVYPAALKKTYGAVSFAPFMYFN